MKHRRCWVDEKVAIASKTGKPNHLATFQRETCTARWEMRSWRSCQLNKRGTTIVMVTHDEHGQNVTAGLGCLTDQRVLNPSIYFMLKIILRSQAF
jgi:hypothetical protein